MQPTPGPAESEALRASEARQAAILKSALDAIVTIDHEGCVLDFNPAAVAMFGYSREEAVGQEMAELIVPESLRDAHRRGIGRAVSTGRDTIAGHRIEITAMRKGGESFPVELAITRIAVEGSPPLFTGHIRDITARRRTEQRQTAQLAATQVLAEAATLAEAAPRLLRTICEGLSWDLGALWVVETETDTLRCVDLWLPENAALEDFATATRSTVLKRLIGLPGRIWASGEPLWIRDVPIEPNFPRVGMAIRSGLRGAFGFPIRLGDRVLGVAEFFSREIREPDDEVLSMLIVIGSQLGQFIQRRRAEEAMRTLNADLERLVRERTMELAEANLRLLENLEREQEIGQLKSNFVSLVSHEFRTPLGIILSSSEILQEYFASLDEAERAEQLDAIKANVLRMSDMMEEVLLFSRLEAGKLPCCSEPIDLPAVCRAWCDELRSATNDRCPAECGFEGDFSGAQADESVLRHIFINLLTNAVKYSPPGSSVSFQVRREGDLAVFEVGDRGIGIPKEAQGRLFDSFYRAPNAVNVPGTGLGLVIVKRCVGLHGGQITIDSEEGAGTRVRVILPLFADHSSS